MDKKKFYTHDEAKDILIGAVGTPQRDGYEKTLEMFLVGDVIKACPIGEEPHTREKTPHGAPSPLERAGGEAVGAGGEAPRIIPI